MRFDAYAGNIWSGPSCSEVAEVMAIGTLARVERGRPRGRYSDVFDVVGGDRLVGWVGRDSMLESAYFEFKGETTPGAVATIRKHWSDKHTVSRADACEDYDDPEAFDVLTAIMDTAKDPRVQSLLLLPREGDRGRTINFGSPQSRAMVRVYEAGKMKERAHLGRPNWARSEGQFRPGKAAEKLLAAKLSALEFWGLAAWTQRAAEALCLVEVPRFAPVVEPVSFDKTTTYLARAFKRHFEMMLEDFGDWECIGREMAAVWAADAAAKESLARVRKGAV